MHFFFFSQGYILLIAWPETANCIIIYWKHLALLNWFPIFYNTHFWMKITKIKMPREALVHLWNIKTFIHIQICIITSVLIMATWKDSLSRRFFFFIFFFKTSIPYGTATRHNYKTRNSQNKVKFPVFIYFFL